MSSPSLTWGISKGNSRPTSPFWFLQKEIFYLYLLQIPENLAIIRFKKAQNEQKR